jgi:2-polyprenyl-3-methyl-5-hydroxy-6-metoxy-1,4-benzoquinol methylase
MIIESEKGKIEYQCANNGFAAVRLLNVLSKYGKEDLSDEIQIALFEDSTFIDEKIVLNVLNQFHGKSVDVEFLGGVDGTIPKFIRINGGLNKKKYLVPHQGLEGVNCSIGRPLRRKIFLRICEEFDDLNHCSFVRFSEIVKSDKVRDICLSYGARDVQLFDVLSCPNCGSNFKSAIRVGEGNAITGFLDASHDVYHHCNNCSLVYLSRQVESNDLGIFYDTSSYDRSQSKEDIIDRWGSLSEASTSHLGNYLAGLDRIKPSDSVLDLGCGDGDFLSLVRSARPQTDLTGVDFHISTPILDAMEQHRITGFSSNIFEYINYLDNSKKFDVITMWEVVEHIKIDDFKSLLRLLKRQLKPDGRLIFSTPDFYDIHSQSLDFWAMAAGEHLYVYNLDLCTELLALCGYKVVEFERESVTTKLPDRWYKYGSKTNTSLSGRACSAIVETVLSDDVLRERLKRQNQKNKIGSELIVIAKIE